MTIRAQLTRKALLALDEVVELSKAGPVAPSFAIRFALAYLYMCGTPKQGVRERWMHDTFWRVMQERDRDEFACSHRSTSVQSALNGIMRSVGIEPDHAAASALREERMRAAPEDVARRRMTAAIREEAALRRAAAEEKRKAKDCGWL